MSYIKFNLKELELTGILNYHNKNILSNGVTVVILENWLNSTVKMFIRGLLENRRLIFMFLNYKIDLTNKHGTIVKNTKGRYPYYNY